jgi:hypothetical protein
VSRHDKTTNIIAAAKAALEIDRPMTVRQVYYKLVSDQIIENNRSQYQAVSKALVAARKEGVIPWDWMIDRRRRPRTVGMWSGPTDFIDVAQQYRRDVWVTQPAYFEVWLEKDALSGIFEEALEPYGVTLNVGIGFDGWDSIRNAADRLGDGTVLYFGDFDPSGEDMVRSLGERLRHFGTSPQIIKCALNREDIERHSLPPNRTKSTDSRTAAFVAKYGDISVELDALPSDVLRASLVAEVEARMDLAALESVREQESGERTRLYVAMAAIDWGQQ